MLIPVLAAYVTDLLVGDPRWMPHPVMFIGKAIDAVEKLLRRLAVKPQVLRMAGVVLALVVVGGSYLLTWALLWLLGLIQPWCALAAEVWLISTTIAGRSLAAAAYDVLRPLMRGDLTEARTKVGWIVGRDTSRMDSADVTRATVETVAENIVDGIVSPLFYALIGGAPLAMAYRAVNTLDSMVGYKNERYIDFGWASARLDDLANYIPARWAGLALVAAAWLSGRCARGAWNSLRRDAAKHPSPNSGITEAAMAGALRIRLGGLNYYDGQASFRSYMGDPLSPLQPGNIRQAVDIMYLTSAVTVVSGLLATGILYRCL